jgi:ATP-dependent helicase/DNAse subunit B
LCGFFIEFMAGVTTQYEVIAPSTDPGPATTAVTQVYAARPKSFFLASMLRTTRASGLRLYPAKRGSIIHRFFDSIAIEFAKLDLAWRDSIIRAIRQSVYYTFRSQFAPPQTATYATSLFRFTRATPALTL